MKSYDHFNCSRASIVQFRTSRYIIRMNRTSELKVLTFWISRDLPLFNFNRLDILCAKIGHPSEKLWPFEFIESFCYAISSVSIYYSPESNIRVQSYDHLNFSGASVVQFRVSRYIMYPDQTSEWKVMTIWISRELPFLNFEHLDILFPGICIRVKSYDHLNFLRASIAQCRASRNIMRLNRTSEWKFRTIWISRELLLFNF